MNPDGDASPRLAILNGRVITPRGVLEGGCLLIDGGRIQRALSAPPPGSLDGYDLINAQGCWVAPGFIDTHTQGGLGVDFLTASPGEMETLLAWLPSVGTTAVLATLTTASQTDLLAAIERVTQVMDGRPPGAELLGIHLEGPYLHPEKAGAQSGAQVRLPNLTEIRQLIEASRGHLRLVTLAPELPGAIEAIRCLRARGIAVSAGHTLAGYEDMLAAIEVGLGRVAHLYNTMPDFNARHPGVIGAALAHAEIYAEIILDGVHVHPVSARVALLAKGARRVLLVTDATQATGLSDGVYIRPGNRRVVVKNGIARGTDGKLAGSTLTMDRAFANAVRLLGLPEAEAALLASATPATSLGLQDRKGSLAPGQDADLVLLDGNYQVQLALARGQLVYSDRARNGQGQ